MTTNRLTLSAAALVAAGLLATGCGQSGGSGSGGSASGKSGGASPNALSADAQSAATGDIPDNQNFLTFKDRRDGFSMRYPEGWAQKRSRDGLTFQDKNNLVRVAVRRGAAPTVASVQAELAKLKTKVPTLKAKPAEKVTIKGAPVIKVVYTTVSTPNDVTGKRVTLQVDRYEYAKGGNVAVLQLGTPKGVDNVDAYRLMSESFKWL